MTDTEDARPTVYIDADACPVKDECYRVAERYGLHVFLVSNTYMRAPQDPRIQQIVVDAGPDIADDWIAERVEPGDIVVTADIPLADRCLKVGAAAISPKGHPFTNDTIGAAMAQRAVMEHIRSTGEITGGPSAFAAADRSRFLSALDEAVNRSIRAR